MASDDLFLPLEQMAAGHWLPGDDLLDGLPLDNVEDVGDLGLDSSGNRLQSDHTQFGWTHPFEGFLPQPTYDDEETGIFSSAIPSFDNYNSGLETTHSSEGEHDHQPTHQQKAYEADAGSVEDQINYEIDHIPLNPTNEEDDKCIENFFRNAKNFRLKNIEHPLLNEFVERVTQKYESVCYLRSIQRISKAFRFENMPVIENNGFVRPINVTNEKYIHKATFCSHFKRLIRWLLFINTAIMRRMNAESTPENIIPMS
ncbi:hypothetical protein PGT21_019289 [Puccinia graminis f. sp. tritici]|uniref:Uncharacterized protein n=1 Tax=Puccinia graminis f. sp. tritici TaxID=56615 RepID=A0A5B0QIC1_PUCGR|nr:hypothetical protein PGT21_019289 [Puccinia graminis f. sp. tritici]